MKISLKKYKERAKLKKQMKSITFTIADAVMFGFVSILQLYLFVLKVQSALSSKKKGQKTNKSGKKKVLKSLLLFFLYPTITICPCRSLIFPPCSSKLFISLTLSLLLHCGKQKYKMNNNKKVEKKTENKM